MAGKNHSKQRPENKGFRASVKSVLQDFLQQQEDVEIEDLKSMILDGIANRQIPKPKSWTTDKKVIQIERAAQWAKGGFKRGI